MSLSRRDFLIRSGLVAGGLMANGLWSRALVRKAFADIGDRFLVSIFLDGGNDGLNTVVPVANGSFANFRTSYEILRRSGPGGLRLSETLLTPYAVAADPNTNTPLALHPGLEGLHRLYQLGKVAVVQGCGYPEYNLSHAVSRTIWETASRAAMGPGWLGRYLASRYGASDIPALSVGYWMAGELRQQTTSVLTSIRLSELEFPLDNWYPDDDPAKKVAFQAVYGEAQASSQPLLRFLGNSGQATLTATQAYPGLDDLYAADRASWLQQYNDLDSGTARRLREIAKVIYGVHQGVPDVGARHFALANGGYDTHANQGTVGTNQAHYELHREVGDALEAFYHDLDDMGVADKVLVMVWSEFSRRPQQNDNGTDHGSQGPVFLIGGKVNGGVYGNHPNISDSRVLNPGATWDDGNTKYSQDNSDPHRSTDFRDVYGAILKHWLQIPQTEILSSLLTPDVGDPNFYWTLPNFDFVHPGNGQPLFLP
ncbi:MAG: hypothetical protein KatS3mg077_2829 [Candidatus Binatia bacterium]|nr:MAG: hypothetical protein KatS3mg077_2829 [Candidatus Binatia bacterium]